MAIIEQFNINTNSIVLSNDVNVSRSELLNEFIGLMSSAGHTISFTKKGTVSEFNIDGKMFYVVIKNISYLGHPHPLSKKRIQLPSDFNEKITNKDYGILVLGRYGYGDGKLWCAWNISKDKRGKSSSLHVNVTDLQNAYNFGNFTKRDRNGNDVFVYRSDMLHNFIKYQLSKKNAKDLDVINNIKSVMLSVLGEDLTWDAVTKYSEMKEENFRNWRQQQWQGFYLEFIANKSDKITTPGPKVGTTVWDSMINGEVVDLKVHSDGKSGYIPGNDFESIQETVKEYGRLFYAVVVGQATLESEELEVSTAWNEMKGGKSKYQEKGAVTNRAHRKLKSKFEVKSVEIIEINASNISELESFQKGFKNSNGKARKEKVKIKLGKP